MGAGAQQDVVGGGLLRGLLDWTTPFPGMDMPLLPGPMETAPPFLITTPLRDRLLFGARPLPERYELLALLGVAVSYNSSIHTIKK
jgi:hypothetical protein